MAYQEKHINTSLAFAQSARFLAGLADLSIEEHCLLLRVLITGERVSPKTESGKALIAAGFVNTFGTLARWVGNYTEEVIAELLEAAGNNLLPQDHPVAIEETLHDLAPSGCRLTAETRDAEEVMRTTRFRVNRRILALASCDVTLTKEQQYVCTLYNSGLFDTTSMYFPVSYDYRGRMYYRGGAITPQGDDLQKGLLEFADGAPLGEHGLAALEMALADAMGIKVPKVEVRARLKSEYAEYVQRDDVSIFWAEWVLGRYGYLAAALAIEWSEATSSSSPETYVSHVVCHQDATCSGLQIAAAITGHRGTAELTNCTASSKYDVRADVYGAVSDYCAMPRFQRYSINALCSKFGRKLVKKTVMTLGYGAGQWTLKRAVVQTLLDIHGIGYRLRTDLDPKGLHNELKGILDNACGEDYLDWEDGSWDILTDALEKYCGATVHLKDQLSNAATHLIEEEGYEFLSWTTHDGFKTRQCIKEHTEEHSIGSVTVRRGAEFKADTNVVAIAPNMVHSLDAAQMREAVRELDFARPGAPVACIHDSLGTRACDYWVAGMAVRKAFHAIDARDVVEDFLLQAGMEVEVIGDYDPIEAQESSYFWC